MLASSEMFFELVKDGFNNRLLAERYFVRGGNIVGYSLRSCLETRIQSPKGDQHYSLARIAGCWFDKRSDAESVDQMSANVAHLQ